MQKLWSPSLEWFEFWYKCITLIGLSCVSSIKFLCMRYLSQIFWNPWSASTSAWWVILSEAFTIRMVKWSMFIHILFASINKKVLEIQKNEYYSLLQAFPENHKIEQLNILGVHTSIWYLLSKFCWLMLEYKIWSLLHYTQKL